jgi:excisionase family DNA binding protein
MQEPMLTVREVAEEPRVSPARVYQLARAGDLPAIRVGRTVRVPPAAYREWQRGLVVTKAAR